jgi:hypothetical protein
VTAPWRARGWRMQEVADRFGITIEDVLLWMVLGGLPSESDEWGREWIRDVDVEALARRPHQWWDEDEHETLPLVWPSTLATPPNRHPRVVAQRRDRCH